MERRSKSTRKRKLEEYEEFEPDTAKPSVRFTPIPGGRHWTLSVAVPCSVMDDCDTAEQRIMVAGRLGRALALFGVDEVVVYDDSSKDMRKIVEGSERDEYTGVTDPCHFLHHVLSYLDTPPYLRKVLYPLHPNLRLAGMLPSLDMPHHPHVKEWIPYREGIVTEGASGNVKAIVDAGFDKVIKINDPLIKNKRVTLQFSNANSNKAEVVHPRQPRTVGGYYWGYEVRRTNCLSAVFTESHFDDGYDVSIGTSERGVAVSKAFPSPKPITFKHLLIVFGGPKGLEYAAENDENLKGKGASGRRTKALFDHWVNVLPNQGSRTIRTDEAVYVTLATLRKLWDSS